MRPLNKTQLAIAVVIHTQLGICRADIQSATDHHAAIDHIHYRWQFIQSRLCDVEQAHGEREPFDCVGNRYRTLLGLLQPGCVMPPMHYLVELLDECIGYLQPYIGGK